MSAANFSVTTALMSAFEYPWLNKTWKKGLSRNGEEDEHVIKMFDPSKSISTKCI